VENAEGSVIMVGDFGSSSRDAVEPHSDEWIEGENRFDLSTNVAERIEDEQEFSNVLVSDGQALESDIVTGETPVLLSGTNFLPDETEEYIQGNEEISSATVIGPQLAVVGREISDSLEAEDRDIRILAKQGHARGGDTQQEVSALPLFPLPFTQLELEINSAEYLPGQDQLLVTLSNPTESDIYKTSAIDLVMDDEILESFADDEPELIPAGSSSIVSYDVDVTEDEAESMDAEFTTAFGGSPINLDTYVESQEENIFGPPKTLPVSILEFEDDSQANISEVFYNTETNEFEVEIINEGEDVEAYARVSLENLEIDGVAESFTSDTVRVEPGESETVRIEALLEEEDLEENEFATVSLSYGERESLLVNSEEHQTSLDAISEGLVDGRNLILLLILAAIISYGVYRSS